MPRVFLLSLIFLAFAWLPALAGPSEHLGPDIFINAQQGDLEALNALRTSAEEGVVDAQYKMGLLYSFGKGVPQNYEESYFWFSVAAEGGSQLAVPGRDLSGSHIQLSRALAVKRRVAEWKPLSRSAIRFTGGSDPR